MELLILLVVVAVVVYFLMQFFGKKVQKPDIGSLYACSGCGVEQKHNKRTLNAWQRGSRSFFCKKCHSEWRESQAGGNRSGCFGIVLICTVVPIAGIIAYSLGA